MQLVIKNRVADMNMDVSSNMSVMGKLQVNVTLKEADGTIVKDGNIIFKINGNTVKNADGSNMMIKVVDGKATIDYQLPDSMSARDYNLTVVYSNKGYERSENTTNFTLLKRDVANVNITNITTDIKHNTTINTTIYDATGVQLKGKVKVSIKIDGKTAIKQKEIVDGKLDVNLATDSLRVGNHKITVITGESSYYAKQVTDIPLIIKEEDEIIKEDI